MGNVAETSLQLQAGLLIMRSLAELSVSKSFAVSVYELLDVTLIHCFCFQIVPVLRWLGLCQAILFDECRGTLSQKVVKKSYDCDFIHSLLFAFYLVLFICSHSILCNYEGLVRTTRLSLVFLLSLLKKEEL